MTTRKHSRKKRNQKGIKWFYITAAGLVSAVILAAILFKIRADSADSGRDKCLTENCRQRRQGRRFPK